MWIYKSTPKNAQKSTQKSNEFYQNFQNLIKMLWNKKIKILPNPPKAIQIHKSLPKSIHIHHYPLLEKNIQVYQYRHNLQKTTKKLPKFNKIWRKSPLSTTTIDKNSFESIKGILLNSTKIFRILLHFKKTAFKCKLVSQKQYQPDISGFYHESF